MSNIEDKPKQITSAQNRRSLDELIKFIEMDDRIKFSSQLEEDVGPIEGKERNRALSVFAAASGSGFAAGLILGGVIIATLGWRWVFDINVPIGIIVSLLSIKYGM
jgi:hypothetical protein